MSGVILPPGVEVALPAEVVSGTIVNETDLPDRAVQHAVETYFEENASVLGVSGQSTFQTYANSGGSLLARGRFRVPANHIEEIVLARDLAERDDDVAATIGAAIALSFGDGMRNQHEDEITVALFDEIARIADLDMAFKEMYREYLTTGQLTTATLFSREETTFKPANGERNRSRSISAPNIGVVPAEQVVILDNDMFRTASLYYRPLSEAQEEWLRRFFDIKTSAAAKAEMRRQDPVLTFLLVEARELPNPIREGAIYSADNPHPASGKWVFKLNPTVTARTTMPKGSWAHPKPPMVRNFPLLEAKRLLNLMDYALLEGGSNFLVVAKKGSDKVPALPEEVQNLHGTIRRAARSGVLVGDHRLNIEIITPDLEQLLNPEKRRLIGRKLSKAILRIPDYQEEDEDSALEILSRVLQSDRRDLRRHVENRIYAECAKRNDPIQSPASIWFPRIVLQGTQYFTDFILKLRDRGDISRRTAVEAGGINYDFEVTQRRTEKARGDDRVMVPAAVPFSSPAAGPQDNNSGRPRGSSSDNGRAGARRRPQGGSGQTRRTIARNAGETVTAMFEEETGWYRAGELTAALLEEFEDTSEIGRLTAREREALDMIASGEHDTFTHGALTIVPVNTAEQVGDIRAVRLTDGISALVGNRSGDDAVLASALVFRHPLTEFDAEEKALAFGYEPPAPPELRVVPVTDGPGGDVVGAATISVAD